MRAIALSAAAAAMIMVAGCGKKEETTATGTDTGTATAAAMKAPKAGLWETTMTVAGQATPAVKTCVGETPAGTTPSFTPPNSGTCSKNLVTPTATGYDIDMECTNAGQTMTMKGTVSGDFENSYSMAFTGNAAGRDMAMQMDSKRLGDCPAGTAPGAVVQ